MFDRLRMSLAAAIYKAPPVEITRQVVGPSTYETLISFVNTNPPQIEISKLPELTTETQVDRVLYDFAVALKGMIKEQRPDIQFTTHAVARHTFAKKKKG